MNNKGFIQIITVLLLLASIYQLSFTFVTNSVKNKAEAQAVSLYGNDISTSAARDSFQKVYLDSMSRVEVYPGLGFTYQECKENELNLGLDLQGGMNVTLEVETPVVIKAMAGETDNKAFLEAFENAEAKYLGQENFVDALEREYNETAPEGKIAGVFYGKGLEIDLPNGIQSSNDEIFEYLKKESESAISRAFEIISTRIDKFGVAQPNVQRLDNGRILIELPGVDDPDRVRRLIVTSAQLEFWRMYDKNKAAEVLDNANKIILGEQIASDSTVESLDTVQADSAIKESIEGTLGDDTDSLANDSTPDISFEEFKEKNPLLSIFNFNLTQDRKNWGGGSVIGFIDKSNIDKFNEYLSRKDVKAIMPQNLRFKIGFKPVEGNETIYEIHALQSNRDGKPSLAGNVITDARPTREQNLEVGVSMTMNQEGTVKWKRLTAEAAKNKESVAIVLDDRVYSSPTVQNEIPNGRSSITGNFDMQEATDLSNILKAGKLPAPVKIVGENTVGPTLGDKAIKAGTLSLAVGFLLVIIFMILYYGKAGLYADIALLVNLVFIIGVLAGLHAALTLPGMAGLVLTIGMAVDANVLIFERIREELQGGKSFKSAIKDGYSGAYSSIIDANITTVIAGVILWVLGKGPVMGFAVILVIGILSSLFTSIFLTRLFIDGDIKKGKETSFYTSISEKFGRKLNTIDWDFIGKRKMFYMISGVLILIGIVSLSTRGLSTGVDFKGGWSYVVNIENANSTDIKAALGDVITDANNEVKTYGAVNRYKITTSYLIESEDSLVNIKVEDALVKSLVKYNFSKEDILSINKVGPTIARDTTVRSIWAIALAIIGMFLYILVRFRNIGFSLGATAAIFHDVLIVFSIYSIFYGILPFELSIDQAFIAAILTVVGYSINDTVVVFDRVREFIGLNKRETDLAPIINRAINTTLSRTLITSLTTLMVILILFIFGGEGLKGFTFALLIGVAVGTYSSVCIATPIVVDFLKKFGK
ncbi:MAG: protein translocase subunit SecDF [Bacteroidetes bacterium]|nr:MAG: protein translocase subunit SecDF [Bacteroidota bacterium]